ncbi:putative nucleic acid-binding protein [Streptomyces sp. V4I8]|uniref:hypothetical protein n=1 Tax=Streptomyces sp. V4I8 TaxID=3156469 RepID=UPI0035134915
MAYWVDAAQYKLTQKGQHRSAGAMDLILCATAVHHGLHVLHRDNDFHAVARVMKDLQETGRPPRRRWKRLKRGRRREHQP